MRVYEIIFILRPEVSDEELKTTVRQVSDAIEEGQGVVDKVESWGKRRLAYSVKRHKEGYYLLIQYSVKSNAGLSKEIERRLKVMDDVIKYMTVRIDEDLKLTIDCTSKQVACIINVQVSVKSGGVIKYTSHCKS